jgi:hypothetical protein
MRGRWVIYQTVRIWESQSLTSEIEKRAKKKRKKKEKEKKSIYVFLYNWVCFAHILCGGGSEWEDQKYKARRRVDVQ